MLRDGFWLMSRVAPSFEDQFTEIDDVRSMKRMSILLNRLKIVCWNPFELIEICMKGILWQFAHTRMIDNVLYGLQGLYQIQILMQSTLVVC